MTDPSAVLRDAPTACKGAGMRRGCAGFHRSLRRFWLHPVSNGTEAKHAPASGTVRLHAPWYRRALRMARVLSKICV